MNELLFSRKLERSEHARNELREKWCWISIQYCAFSNETLYACVYAVAVMTAKHSMATVDNITQFFSRHWLSYKTRNKLTSDAMKMLEIVSINWKVANTYPLSWMLICIVANSKYTL